MERSAKCLACYKRWPDRFWAKVDKSGECWIWTRHIDSDGYGISSFGGRNQKAHRIAWEMANGPIPTGLTLDHLCRVRSCVNPAHLEPVPVVENVMRGHGVGSANASKTECVNGHPFDAVNTYIGTKGHRGCIACRRAADRRYKGRQVARDLTAILSRYAR